MDTQIMAAKAAFTCRPNSHPFQERVVVLTEPIKVGRSVARARPALNNMIFDCKVLSRNHALLWYENGKFFLQDTKSSNGTFVNNQRLSKGSEESAPREIYSTDIIQFGVDVMENQRRVTHGCIIAQVALYHPDGKEALPSASSTPYYSMGPPGFTIQTQDLYQLAQYLEEAMHREQMLENKLATLQRVIIDTQEQSENSWQAMIDEERLLSRLEVLESQLHLYSKGQTDENLRKELTVLHEEKSKYENNAKDSLKRVLQEKLDAVGRVTDLERCLSNSEDECEHLRNMVEECHKEIGELCTKHTDLSKEIDDLKLQVLEAENLTQEKLNTANTEKTELLVKIESLEQADSQSLAKIEALQAENDFTKEQLSAVKCRLDTTQSLLDQKNSNNASTPSDSVNEDHDDKTLDDAITMNTDSTITKDDELTQLRQKYLKVEELNRNLTEKMNDCELKIESTGNSIDKQLLNHSLHDNGDEDTSNSTESSRLHIIQLQDQLESERERMKLKDNEINDLRQLSSESAVCVVDDNNKMSDYVSGASIDTDDSSSTQTPTIHTNDNGNTIISLETRIDHLQAMLDSINEERIDNESMCMKLKTQLSDMEAIHLSSTEEYVLQISNLQTKLDQLSSVDRINTPLENNQVDGVGVSPHTPLSDTEQAKSVTKRRKSYRLSCSTDDGDDSGMSLSRFLAISIVLLAMLTIILQSLFG